jgi:type II secretory pathway pseudopilin PulG
MALAGVLLAVALPGVAQQRKKIVISDEMEVEGQVQKPQVTYIVTRQDIEDEEQLKLSTSFIPKIVESVEKEPF